MTRAEEKRAVNRVMDLILDGIQRAGGDPYQLGLEAVKELVVRSYIVVRSIRKPHVVRLHRPLIVRANRH